jgi:hypothetical protein
MARGDFRTEGPGSFRYYLIHDYPNGQDYQTRPSERAGFRMHDARRDWTGNFINLAGGRPDFTAQFWRTLEGVPHQRFTDALEAIALMDHLRTPGRNLVAALHYYQFNQEYRSEGWTASTWARHLGASSGSTLGKWRDACIELVEAEVFQAIANATHAANERK